MATTPQLRVLFFDVFGTCVAQRTPVADELWKAAQEALESDVSSISSEVRAKATDMVCYSRLSTRIKYKLIPLQSYEQWFEFGGVSG
jgi:2-haloacid dehalogenase